MKSREKQKSTRDIDNGTKATTEKHQRPFLKDPHTVKGGGPKQREK